MRKKQISVIGDASCSKAQYQLAYEVGVFVASHNTVLITGGRGGVMDAASKGASELGGVVVGILPGLDDAQANTYCNVVIPTGLGHMRNAINVQAAIGGGAGTLTEIAFTWIHQKPVLCFTNVEGWSQKLAGEVLDNRIDQALVKCEDMKVFKEKFKEILNDISKK